MALEAATPHLVLVELFHCVEVLVHFLLNAFRVFPVEPE